MKLRYLSEGHWKAWTGKQTDLSFIKDRKSRYDKQRLVPISSTMRKKMGLEKVTVKCFKCNSDLSKGVADNNYIISELYDGLIFRSYGNFGSTVYDPMSNEFIEISICDKCIVEHKEHIKRVVVSEQKYGKIADLDF